MLIHDPFNGNFRQCPIKRILLSGLIARIENKDRIRTFDYSDEKSGANPITVKEIRFVENRGLFHERSK